MVQYCTGAETLENERNIMTSLFLDIFEIIRFLYYFNIAKKMLYVLFRLIGRYIRFSQIQNSDIFSSVP